MLSFPNCKINLGLSVIKKREDGFHDLESVFYPIAWCDSLEIIENEGIEKGMELSTLGITIDGHAEDNILYKTYQQILQCRSLPAFKTVLYKNIPFGAGLGGGSADAAFFIRMLNEKYALSLSMSEQHAIALSVGSDVPFFLKNIPVLATGRGDQFKEVSVDLSSYFILLVYPNIVSNTKVAYSGIMPDKGTAGLIEKVIANFPVQEWKGKLKNQFEENVFRAFPELEKIKQKLYDMGALYASMSGSGSTLFGIFDQEPSTEQFGPFKFYLQKPGTKIL